MRGLPGTARLSIPAERPGSAEADPLLQAALDLAGAQDVARVADVVRRAARALTGADGVTFVLREGDQVHYLDEDAIAPLWKGMRFPASLCISGWAMQHRRTVVIEDVLEDARIPRHLYAPTFVKSLAMVPVRPEDPVAAIGAYWAVPHRATPREIDHLGALAGFAAVALANVALVAELRQAIEARDTFMAVAAHELRTPLSALALQVGLCERQLAGGGDRREALGSGIGRIGRATRRLSELVERLLDLSTLQQRPLALEREPVDLVAIAREAAEVAGGGQAEIRIDGPERLVGRFDRVRVAQALENLLANAVKFGAGAPVDVAISEAPLVARVAVRDRGIGISPEARERIFDRFERAVPTRNFGGFGLGLWLVRQIVEAHGGTVDVASAPRAGATFTVELPLR